MLRLTFGWISYIEVVEAGFVRLGRRDVGAEVVLRGDGRVVGCRSWDGGRRGGSESEERGEEKSEGDERLHGGRVLVVVGVLNKVFFCSIVCKWWVVNCLWSMVYYSKNNRDMMCELFSGGRKSRASYM